MEVVTGKSSRRRVYNYTSKYFLIAVHGMRRCVERAFFLFDIVIKGYCCSSGRRKLSADGVGDALAEAAGGSFEHTSFAI
jgi:hypothetical protein